MLLFLLNLTVGLRSSSSNLKELRMYFRGVAQLAIINIKLRDSLHIKQLNKIFVDWH